MRQLLATARVTRLITEDKITEPIRDEIAGRWPDSRLSYLVSCPACVSVWGAAAVVLLSKTPSGRALVHMLALSESVIVLKAAHEWLEARSSTAVEASQQ